MLTMLRLSSNLATRATDGTRLTLPTSVTSICRLATGRSALYHLISRLPQAETGTVLMPCYVAEGVIKPFRSAEIKIRFYRLNADLTPCADDVDAILADAVGTVLVVLIHYFGFSAWTDHLRDVLDAHQPIILEDCAHAPLTTTAQGQSLAEHADLALYSLNKFLPVADGAILLSRRDDIDVSMDTDSLPELPKKALDAFARHLAACRALYECTESAQSQAILNDVAAHYEDYYAVINDDLSPHRQSTMSREIEDAYPYVQSVQQRRKNAHYLYKHMETNALIPVHSALPDGVVPFGIPARVPQGRRDEILKILFEHGVLLSTLEDKWNFVPHDRQTQFSFETDFLKDHVLIPISEFITNHEMETMVHELNQI